MDFESPDVMKDFPGLYSTETNKKSNDSDYSDESNDKVTKKELLIGKRKDKKDNKKDRGYAALEGESSAEEDCEAKSPSKAKKTKSFKFSTKNKEKREKNRDKEKDGDKKREKDNRKTERSKEKSKDKFDKKDRKVKQVNDEKNNIEEVLPIFGVNLQIAVERSRCHDGVELPLPVRNCIDYVLEHGLTVENVYKVTGIKSKVLHIKKIYNQREVVNLADYDVPTVTSVFKLFFRELPEPILGDSLTRFEEAAAVQNVATRERNLIALIEKLPVENQTLLAWSILHLDAITANEKYTKMNAQVIAMTLSPVLQMSHRLLVALLCHCKTLFKDTTLLPYRPPLMTSTSQLPEDIEEIKTELKKQESLLSQIHYEMNSGFVSKKREELLWEVQRMITQLKRKLRTIQKCNENCVKIPLKEENTTESSVSQKQCQITKSLSCSDDDTFQQKHSKRLHPDDTSEATTSNSYHHETTKLDNTSDSDTENLVPTSELKSISDNDIPDAVSITKSSDEESISVNKQAIQHLPDSTIIMLQNQNHYLIELKEMLVSQIAAEKSKLVYLKYCLANQSVVNEQFNITDMEKLDEIMELLANENRILKIKKTDLVREIMEQREACINLKSKLYTSTLGIR